MHVAQVTAAQGPIEVVERPVLDPGPGKVRVKVEACGLCHSDVITKESLFPGIVYPRIPGHEVAGVVDALGEGVANWKVGQRVGIGWIGGHCTVCQPCRRGKFATCERAQIPGIVYDGATGKQTEIPSPRANQREYYVGIRDAILGKCPVPIPVKYAIAGMAVLETSFESGARGQTLPVPLTAEERAEWS